MDYAQRFRNLPYTAILNFRPDCLAPMASRQGMLGARTRSEP
jgi:hypothetical protein